MVDENKEKEQNEKVAEKEATDGVGKELESREAQKSNDIQDSSLKTDEVDYRSVDDINKLIAEIEADTQKKQDELKQKIAEEVSKKYETEIKEYQEKSQKVIDELKKQIEELKKQSQDKISEVINEYKNKITEQAKQINSISKELSERQSIIPPEINPYRKKLNTQTNVGIDLADMDNLSEEEKLELFYRALRK